jgi:hypothetical protein
MNNAAMQAEHDLAADLQAMARLVQTGVQLGESPTVWKARREQIAALRERIRALRDRHLGGSWTSSPMSRQ